ncbi:MAG: efflux RND transporter permease subunit [bacterium]|nr:efflux RND transporter permease subunit [bacterium]
MFLSDASLKRPIAMTVGLIILMLFGVLSFRNVGVDVMPRVDVPYITVTVPYPGASPTEIETSVAKRVEEAVVQVDGLKHVTTTCAKNYCTVMMEFELGRDVDVLATDVREKIDLVRGDFPSVAEDPRIVKYDVNAMPVATFALTGNRSVEEMYDYADNRLKDRFSTLGGVSSVELVGGEKREVVVTVDRTKLAAAGLTMPQIVQAVGKGNLKVPAGQITDTARELSVTFDAEAETPEELGAIEVGAVKGTRLYLRDVATFGWGSKRLESLAFHEGRPAIAISVSKKGEANGVAVVDAVRRVFDEEGGHLPDGMQLVWVRDSGAFTNASVVDGLSTIFEGIALTGFILILFLGDWRSVVAAFVSIPVSILISMNVFPLFGYSMNLITMSAVGISVGMLVDNSIVVLENIAKRAERMKEEKGGRGIVGKTIGRATGEVAVAVLASSLTNVVVFLPLMMMKSLPGQFLKPFAIVVAVSSFASLLVSFTLTPILAQLTAGRLGGINRVLGVLLKPWDLLYRGICRVYFATLGGVTRLPKTFVLLCTAGTVAGFMWCAPRVQSDFTPKFDQGEMTVRLEFPSDSTLEKSADRARAILEKVEAVKDSLGQSIVTKALLKVGRTQGTIGQVGRGTHLAEIALKTTERSGRRDHLDVLLARMRTVLAEEPDVIVQVMSPSPLGGTAQLSQLNILGDDLAVLSDVGRAAAREIAAEPSATDVSHTVRPDRPEVKVKPNRAVLQDLGLTPDTLGLSLRASVAGLTPATFTRGDRSYDVRVRFAETEGVEQIEALNFPGPDGRPFPLAAVAEIERTVQPVQIVRCDRRRAQMIYANNAPGYGLGTTLARQREIVEARLPRGYAMTFGGTAEYMEETMKEFGLVTVVAVVLAYLLLCAIMESWLQPFAILFTVPFSYLGIFLICALTGTTLSIFGLLGGIMLVGVVVNAAILFVDEFNRLRREERLARADAVRRAMEEKLRPILMSVVTSLFGMLPMALGTGLGSELRASMGIAALGGMFVSTLVSLYFVPALYASGGANRS